MSHVLWEHMAMANLCMYGNPKKEKKKKKGKSMQQLMWSAMKAWQVCRGTRWFASGAAEAYDSCTHCTAACVTCKLTLSVASLQSEQHVLLQVLQGRMTMAYAVQQLV